MIPSRVLYLSIDLFAHGGIQRYSRYEIRALNAICPGGVRVCSFGQRVAHGFDDPVPLAVIGRGRGWIARAIFSIETMWHALRWRPDLIICDHVNLAPLARLLGAFPGARYWVNVYAIEVWNALPLGRRLALRRADRVVSDCEFTRQYLQQAYPELAGRVDLLRDCVDTTRFTPDHDDAVEEPPSRPLRLLTVSRLLPGRSKGHAAVLTAMSLLADRGVSVTYTIGGDGPDRGRLERLATTLRVKERVTFLGRVPEADLPATYRGCDVFVLVSAFTLGALPQGEGIPLVVLEAQASGKPAITSRCDGSAESIVDGETGFLVRPEDPEDIADAVERLAEAPLMRRAMKGAARRHVEQTFAFTVFTDALRQILSTQRPGA